MYIVITIITLVNITIITITAIIVTAFNIRIIITTNVIVISIAICYTGDLSSSRKTKQFQNSYSPYGSRERHVCKKTAGLATQTVDLIASELHCIRKNMSSKLVKIESI